MATKSGLIKKTKLEEYASIRKVGKIAIKLMEDDELIGVETSKGEDDILIASHDGKAIRFSEKDVRCVGRDSQGVRSLKLDKNDYIVDMAIIRPGSQIITISENGYGKRSNVDEFRLQTRGGKGVKAGVFNSKTGKLVALRQSYEEDDLLLIADNGVIIRTAIDQISALSRVSQGVKIMRLKEGNKIVGVAITAKEEEIEQNAEEKMEEAQAIEETQTSQENNQEE